MKVISFVTQKGGSGKTTLTINCAVAAIKTKKKVLIIDMDAQGTAEAWYQDREEESPQLVRISGNDLEEAIDLAKIQKFDWILIDTPGRDEPAVAAAIKVSDFCIIPCRPSPADMKATPPTKDTIRRLGKTAAFVLTQTPPRSFRIKEAERGLGVLGTVCPVTIVLRNAYQDAQGAGLGVIEFEPKGRAAEEVTNLWNWIVKKIGKISYGKETNIT
jgi:chromosome partitioning protein